MTPVVDILHEHRSAQRRRVAEPANRVPPAPVVQVFRGSLEDGKVLIALRVPPFDEQPLACIKTVNDTDNEPITREGGRPRIFARPLDDITRYWHGVPFLGPEAVLLIKARPGTNRPRTDDDQRAFEAALPVLSAAQRSWLKDAIERPPRLQEPAQRQQQPPRQHRRTAQLAASPGPAG
jgi:hypothetical protein